MNIQELIIDSNLINFIIALVLVFYFLAKFIPDSSKKRKEELETEIAAAENAKKDAEQKLIELEKEIERSKAESLKIVSTAKETAENIKDKIVAEAKEEISRLNQNAEKEMELQKTMVINNIKAQIASIAMNEIEKNLNSRQKDVDRLIQNRLKKDLQKI